jgi:2-iminoacetate synthase
MSVEIPSVSPAIVDWVRRTDPHAGHRLPLLEEAERLLAPDGQPGKPVERRRLAAKLERWRYQHLERCAGRVGAEDRRLVDVLDLAANELAGRPPRNARAVRWAIGAQPRDRAGSGDWPALAEALACLEPGMDLETVVARARKVTDRHFGRPGAEPAGSRRRMALYAPLYLSSHCINYCTYCGFRHPRDINRKHLNLEEILGEAAVLKGRGFRHVLLVAGDFPRLTSAGYCGQAIGALCQRGLQPTVEIAPQSTDDYALLAAAGAHGVTLYQETYDEARYAVYHPRGSKAAFDWRLEGLERAAEAGIERLGLGFLLGLADPRDDLAAMLRHGRYLESRFPGRVIAFSLPRIREAPQGFQAPFTVDDATFVRLYAAVRIAFPRAELVLSTREAAALRNQLAAMCITQISAGSSTTPGGYCAGDAELRLGEQFPVCDRRSPAEVAEWLNGQGFRLTWGLPQ